MYQMTESERAERATIKALHLAVRAQARNPPDGVSRRDALLAWAFVRGLPYRRIERTTRRQTMPDGKIVEHNRPGPTDLARALAPFLPAFAIDLPPTRWGWIKSDSLSAIRLGAWLDDPDGAIPAPVRVKAPYAGQRGNPRDRAARAAREDLPVAAE